jgi:diguanylate cyclase (GGDEF)-like protein
MGEGRKPPESAAGPATATPVPRYEDPAQEIARLRADRAHLVEVNRRLRAEAHRRDEMLVLATEDLLGGAAALVAQARRVSRDPAVPEPRRRAAAAIERNAMRVATTARALAALPALEGSPGRRRTTDLGALLSRIAQDLAPTARAHGVALACEIPAGSTASVDPEALAAALALLLDAAVDAAPRGGRVRVALEPVATGARIIVEESRRTAAPAGARTATPLPSPQPGRGRWLSGVELAFCRAVAELHGGELAFARRGGARIANLTLPLDAHADSPPAAEPVARPRLLVADEDPESRAMVTAILSDAYDVLFARDGLEALQLAHTARPDVVLMDLYMARLDGLAALQALRAEPLTAELPVILVSARGDELTRARSLDLGAVDFLQKPFSRHELRARIDRTLRLTLRESQLAELARTDPLTGLANVRALRARLDEEVKRARRYRTPLACVMVDMDHLKPINDELGHAAGDLAIAAVADVIRRELRETDFGARYGGDEFVVLLPHTTAGEARVFADRVCARLREASVDVGDRRVGLAASFGLAALTDDALGDDAGDELVRRADAALYEAKRAGRGQVAADASAGDGAADAP